LFNHPASVGENVEVLPTTETKSHHRPFRSTKVIGEAATAVVAVLFATQCFIEGRGTKCVFKVSCLGRIEFEFGFDYSQF